MLTLRSITRIVNPPYLFRPNQIVNRIWREFAWRSSTREIVRLPWGLNIIVNPHEAIGYNISTQGLYELTVTEALWRLSERGELAVDVGANIGYTASVLGMRVGSEGRVVLFEPHPEVFKSLSENVKMWQENRKCGAFILHNTALGKGNGVALLKTNEWFKTNKGTAWITNGQDSSEGATIYVRTEKLDSVLHENERIGVMKIDAQGAELDILTGMTEILTQRRVRDIVFEEFGEFPAPTHRFLQSMGYAVFGLEPRLLGLRCLPDTAPSNDNVDGDPPNYLGSIEPARAVRRLSQLAWRSFGILSCISEQR
ncbi:MAG: FkbM family methyltransferase [Candidatus Acidiferrales bacterium]